MGAKIDFSQFISTSSYKSPASKVQVTIFNSDHVIRTYEAPAGFQFDRYLMQLFPNDTIKISYWGGNTGTIKAETVHLEDGSVETHVVMSGDVYSPDGWKAEIYDEYGTIRGHKGTYIK